MKALVVQKQLRRFVAARILSTASTSKAIDFGPLQLIDKDPPKPKDASWVSLRTRLSGICGSDTSTILAKSSRYFEPLISFPFVPGHEIVAELATSEGEGKRYIVEPALHCEIRALPLCRYCKVGHTQLCESVTLGSIEPGIQLGYCNSTGGGWSAEFIAHRSQLHEVPPIMSDKTALMVEPLACAIHAVLRPSVAKPSSICILGAGTIGLTALIGARTLLLGSEITVVAKHPLQRDLARQFGADRVISPGELMREARRSTTSITAGKWISGGFDVIFDCVGSSKSIEDAIRATRPRGKVVAVGMPATITSDLASLWHREIEILGSYAYGTEELSEDLAAAIGLDPGKDSSGELRARTFELAILLGSQIDLAPLVTHLYSIEDYVAALRRAVASGSEDAVKVAFDFRSKAPHFSERNK